MVELDNLLKDLLRCIKHLDTEEMNSAVRSEVSYLKTMLKVVDQNLSVFVPLWEQAKERDEAS